MVRQNFQIYKQLTREISTTNSKYSVLNFEYNFTMRRNPLKNYDVV